MKTFKWITALAFFGMMAFGVRAASRAEEHAMRKGYEHKKKNDTTALPDVRRYIRWAVQHRDYGHLCQAYKDAVLFSPSPSVKLKYADSALVAAVYTRDNARIVAAHLTTGTVYYYSFRQYKNALSQYLLADKYTDRLTDRYLKYKITYHIGVVRSYLGIMARRHCSLSPASGITGRRQSRPAIPSCAITAARVIITAFTS